MDTILLKKNWQCKVFAWFCYLSAFLLLLMLRAMYNLEEETLWPLSQFISHNPYEDAMFRMFDYITVKV